MLILNESTKIEDKSFLPTENDIIFENLSSQLEINTKYDYGRFKLLETHLDLTDETNPFPTNNTSISKWSISINNEISQHFKNLKKSYMDVFTKFHNEINNYIDYSRKNAAKNFYINNPKEKVISLTTQINEIMSMLDSIEREVSTNVNEQDVLSFISAMSDRLYKYDVSSNVDVYKIHLDAKDVTSNFVLCRSLLIQTKKALTNIGKNYTWESIKSNYLPPDSETHFKILFVYTTTMRKIVSKISELFSEINKEIYKITSDFDLFLKDDPNYIETFNPNSICESYTEFVSLRESFELEDGSNVALTESEEVHEVSQYETLMDQLEEKEKIEDEFNFLSEFL